MKIVVLAGGLSPERDVSLSSGCQISNALLGRGHEICLLDLYSQDEALGQPRFVKRPCEPFRYDVPAVEPDLAALRERSGNGEAQIGPQVLEWCRRADLVFIALHGAAGENGQLQAALDLWGIPYTGTGYAGSLLAMDKHLSKQLMVARGISTPAWKLIGRGEAGAVADEVGYPCVVKPCGCGSSVGVTIAREAGELRGALELAWKYEETALVEQYITGREFSVGILDGRALPVIEIIAPDEGFYDYERKYQPGAILEVCPAQLREATTALLQEAALQVHRTLGLGFYSRVDFLLDDGGRHYCLEANTLPGMTPTSLLPQEAAAAGMDYPELCERIARAACSCR